MGVNVFKINPAHIKVYNQYVECCCSEEEKTKLLKKLGKIPGVTNVSLEPSSIGTIIVFCLALIPDIQKSQILSSNCTAHLVLLTLTELHIACCMIMISIGIWQFVY